MLALCALCLGPEEAEAAWAVLVCSELTGAGDGATSCEAAVFIPQLSLTYGVRQEDKLDLEPALHGGKIIRGMKGGMTVTWSYIIVSDRLHPSCP